MTRTGQSKMFPDIPAGSRILLGPEISQLAQTRELVNPFAVSHLAPCSYDLSAGSSYVIAGAGTEENTGKDPLIIGPGSYAGLVSAERVKVPDNIYMLLGPKRKLSYDGIILLSGSVVDPGYEGHLLFVLYNSSGKKRVVYPGKKICVATFFQLDKSVGNPIGRDPSLFAGDFPGEFLDSMANMELPSMVEITAKLEQINLLQQRVLDLEKTYSDVTKPMKELIESVGKVTRDVETLAEQGKRVLGKIEEHDTQFTTVKQTISEQGFKLKYVFWVATILITVLTTLTVAHFYNATRPIFVPTTGRSTP